MPVGFKNGTDGAHARWRSRPSRCASHPHHFLSVTKQGVAAIVATIGNRDCHVILRGGSRGPNYGAERGCGRGRRRLAGRRACPRA